jgi:hypothetical protein
MSSIPPNFGMSFVSSPRQQKIKAPAQSMRFSGSGGTEYDYSPEARQQYEEKLARIAYWVRTKDYGERSFPLATHHDDREPRRSHSPANARPNIPPIMLPGPTPYRLPDPTPRRPPSTSSYYTSHRPGPTTHQPPYAPPHTRRPPSTSSYYTSHRPGPTTHQLPYAPPHTRRPSSTPPVMPYLTAPAPPQVLVPVHDNVVRVATQRYQQPPRLQPLQQHFFNPFIRRT